MRTTQLTAMLLVIALAMVSNLHAQSPDEPPHTEMVAGREYWIAFQKNFRDWLADDKTQGQRRSDPLQLELTISSGTAARGYVEIRGLNFYKTFEIPEKGGIVTVAIDTAAQVRSAGKAEDVAVHVVSDNPVIVYGLNHRHQTTDTYLAYPVEALGRSYRAVGYRWLQNDLLSQFAIVATEDETTITITPSVRIQHPGHSQESRSPASTTIPASATDSATDSAKTMEVRTVRPKSKARKASKQRGERSVEVVSHPPATNRMRRRSTMSNAAREVDLPWKSESSQLEGNDFAPVPSSRTVAGTGSAAGVPFTIVLNKGEVYQVIPRFDPKSMSDLTGSLIVADKPIAMFSGHNCAYVPDPKVKACNLLVEQLPPIDTWGSEFVVGQFLGRSSSVVRVIASEDSTEVIADGVLVATINAGQFYENVDLRNHTRYTSSRPVLVAEFAKGFDNGDNISDPMMIIIPPVESFERSYIFSTPVRGSWKHFINLVAPVEALSTLLLDGESTAGMKFTPIAGTALAVIQIEVAYGQHTVTCAQPIGLYQYGFGYDESAYDAYGNAGGWQRIRTAGSAPQPKSDPEIAIDESDTPPSIEEAPAAIESPDHSIDQEGNSTNSPKKIDR